MALRLAKHIPLPLLDNPERVFINLAAMVLGVAGLIPPPGGVLDAWPDWLQYEWSISILVGGTAALHGAWTGYRPSERLGASLFCLCSLMFAVGVAFRFGLPGAGTVIIFTALAFAKALRVIRSLAISAEAHAALRIRAELDRSDDR